MFITVANIATIASAGETCKILPSHHLFYYQALISIDP